MFDSDYFADKGEAELIIERAKSELFDLLTDEIKGKFDKVKELDSEIKNLNNTIWGKQKLLESINKEIRQMEGKKNDLPAKFVAECAKLASGGFVPNQRVWFIAKKTITHSCPVCNGTKSVYATINGASEMTKIKCPNCGGCGVVFDTEKSVEVGVVEDIEAKIVFRAADVYPNYETDRINVTGYGTFSPDDLFKSREDAERALRGDV